MRLIDADKFREFLGRQYHNCHGYSGNKKEIYREALRAVKSYVHREGQIAAVPVSELKKLRDYLYAEDLISMHGLAELNKLIANYGAKMDEVRE